MNLQLRCQVLKPGFWLLFAQSITKITHSESQDDKKS
jgi:hypothetical protein